MPLSSANFIHVMIPAADIGECDFHAHIGFDQLRDLPHAVAEASARIARAVCRLIGRFLNRLQQRDGFERLAPGAVEHLIARARVHRLQHLRRRGIAHVEVVQILHRDRVLRAAQRARQVGPRLTARTGESFPSAAGSARFSQPSLVAFRPGVPDSM